MHLWHLQTVLFDTTLSPDSTGKLANYVVARATLIRFDYHVQLSLVLVRISAFNCTGPTPYPTDVQDTHSDKKNAIGVPNNCSPYNYYNSVQPAFQYAPRPRVIALAVSLISSAPPLSTHPIFFPTVLYHKSLQLRHVGYQ